MLTFNIFYDKVHPVVKSRQERKVMLNSVTLTPPNPVLNAQISRTPLDSEHSNHARRVIALLDAYPTLSLAIATAMVECAAQEPTGILIAQLERALDQFDTLSDVTHLSGSQVRVLDVALRQISARISQLQIQLQRAWEND